MSYYQSTLRLIADDIERGLLLDGSSSLTLSVGAPARDELGEALDNGADPNAVAWDRRSHLERHIKSPAERLGVMADIWGSAPDVFVDLLRAESGSTDVIDAAMGFSWSVVEGCEIDDDIFEQDWEGGDHDVRGSASYLAAEICHGVIRAGEGLLPADVLIGALRKAANSQFATQGGRGIALRAPGT